MKKKVSELPAGTKFHYRGQIVAVGSSVVRAIYADGSCDYFDPNVVVEVPTRVKDVRPGQRFRVCKDGTVYTRIKDESARGWRGVAYNKDFVYVLMSDGNLSWITDLDVIVEVIE